MFNVLDCCNAVRKCDDSSLDARIADFDALAKISITGKFEIIVIDGAMIFGEVDMTMLDNEK
jgi:hypothetical protein